MRTLLLLAAMAGCDNSGVVVTRGADGNTSQGGVPFDLSGDFPDGGCEACIGDGRSPYLSCSGHRCLECSNDSDCATAAALGPRCVVGRCTCVPGDGGSGTDCIGNANGPICSGLPAFCGCTSPTDCPSGICAPDEDDYVGGSVCAPE